MTASDLTAVTSPPDENVPAEYAVVGLYQTPQDGFDHGLVIAALGHAYWLMPTGPDYLLLVETRNFPHVRAELAKYERESMDWPPRNFEEKPTMVRWDFITPLIWALVVTIVFRGQWTHPRWIDRGLLDATAVFERGEAWRLFTALFLHQNAVHLLSNLCGGVYFFAAVLSVFGRARGWVLLALGGNIGNLGAAALHYPGDYRSMGASTALFAGLGLLSGRAVRNALKTAHPHRWRSFLIPLASGLIVLALYGAGGPEVDVLAHCSGFGCGLVLGLLVGRPALEIADRNSPGLRP